MSILRLQIHGRSVLEVFRQYMERISRRSKNHKMDTYTRLTMIELTEFAELVAAMRSAQEEFNRMKYSPDFEKRAEIDDERRDLQRKVDRVINEILGDD